MRDESPPPRRGPARPLALALLLAGIAAMGGCGEDDVVDGGFHPLYISPRTQPSDVVQNLQTAYKSRDVVQYARLLGSDFQFWFDPGTRTSPEFPALPEFWTRLQDSTGTGSLFSSDDISNIKIELTYGPDVRDNRVGHQKWRKIEITDTFLSLDRAPQGGGSEPTTLIVDGDLQAFYLRKGFTEGDTLPGSTTANEWFLVEWRDLAQERLSAPEGLWGARPAATQTTTWSSIRALFSK